MTYDENNRLLTYNGDAVKYDKDGNMIYGPLAGEMKDFVYDCRNRLIKAGDTIYTYDAENNRIGVETCEKKIEYVINTQPELSQVLQSTETKISENDNNGLTTYYFYGNGLTAQDDDKDYLSYHFNNVGSTMAVTDAKGSVVETYSYTPYGELIDGEYREDIPFLYNGQYGVTTDNNGLYYMKARYYNVEIKRFINQDVLLGVLERVSSLNRYSYVEGNPISYLDPFGLEQTYFSKIHQQISEIQTCLLIMSMISLGITALATAAGGLLVADVFISVYGGISFASSVLSAIDVMVCTANAYTVNDTTEKLKSIEAALFSLLSVVSPIKEIRETGKLTVELLKSTKDVFSSFLNWLGSESAEVIFSCTR